MDSFIEFEDRGDWTGILEVLIQSGRVLELTILGSGTAALQAERGPSGYLLKVADSVCMLDGGSGTLLKSLQAGVSYKDIDKLFYTHTHSDHTMDLVPFLFANKYTPGFKRRKKLTIHGPIGFTAFYDKLLEAFGPSMTEAEYDIEVIEFGGGEFFFENCRVETGLMQHSENAIGYRFEHAGKTFVYSGDTDFCDGIVTLARKADLLLLECSFPDDKKVEGHLTPTEAGKIARMAEVRKVILTHIFPPFDPEEMVAAVRGQFEGAVSIAHDLQIVII